MTTKSELKRFFENGDVPDQEQFWAWLESYWHKEEMMDAASMQYTNPLPSIYPVGGVPVGTTFDQMPIKDLLDLIFYGKTKRTLTITTTPVDATVKINDVVGNTSNMTIGTTVSYTVERPGYFPKTATVTVTEDMTIDVALEPDLSNTEITFTVRTTQLNEQVPIALLRTSDTQTLAKINYGDGKEDLVSVPPFNGSQSWTDNEGNIHYVDNGNTFYHVFDNIGDYVVTINAGSNVSYVRFCEGLTSGAGYLSPTINNYVQEISKFRSDSLANLDYTFAGLSQANVSTSFKLETPQVTSMNATFYGFGVSREFDSFPADMLAQITKPTILMGTFFKAGLKKILPGLLDSFADLVSVFECFKNSKLGKGYYNGITAGNYRDKHSINSSYDFIPVSLFWKNPKLKDVSHCFNYIGEGGFGNLTSGYLAFNIVRRELFWNGKSVGNATGTIENAFYLFAKNNRILCEANFLKYAPNMKHIGGMFTQTNHVSHAISWGGMIPIAKNETTSIRSNDGGQPFEMAGNGLTYDLNVMFPDASYPNILTLNGAFTAAATGATYGFNHDLNYTASASPVTINQSFNAADFLAKFPNAKAGSVDAYAKQMLGQSGGTTDEKNDGRNGVFYLLNQDTRITDKATLPALVFNNAIPY
ncbi:PEGA domain-containing protein [Sphingobacterium sp. SRCM116780]|uniref:PEGA domain-containing protein n=1 Tax=Sphingobacterium sp. SRCM116780 TaxID=2907623 RepID=UPI001F3DF46D|nr:PEGA domain-containing protein [Sphingobacterium sp. SRCM116780]UIR55067.1 PEGA domain-containing protein [Sphingobacterium sp. SRCM116780]